MPNHVHFRAYRNGDEYYLVGFIEYTLIYHNDTAEYFVDKHHPTKKMHLSSVFQATHLETNSPCIIIQENSKVYFLMQGDLGCEVITLYPNNSEFRYDEYLSLKVKNEQIYTFDDQRYPYYEVEIRAAIAALNMKLRRQIAEPECMITKLIAMAQPLTAAVAAQAAATTTLSVAQAVMTAASPVAIAAAVQAQTAMTSAFLTLSRYFSSQGFIA
jgi:hypothetical protein